MATGSGPKVRLVKCPKCLKLLTEVEDVPVYQCGGCLTILQAKKRSINANGTPRSPETSGAQTSISANGTSSSPETNGAQTSINANGTSSSPETNGANGTSSSPETNGAQTSINANGTSSSPETNGAQTSNNANGTSSSPETNGAQTSESQPVSEFKGSSSSSHDMVLLSSGEFSSGQEHENGQNGSVDSLNEQLADIKLSNGDQTDDIQRSGDSVGDSEHEGEYSRLEANNNIVAVAAEPGSNLRSLSTDDQPVAAREKTLSVGTVLGQEDVIFSSDAIVTSPSEEEHNDRHDYHGHPHVASTDDLPSGDLANKNPSAYDGSVSSSDGREDQIPDSQMYLSISVDANAGSVAPEERLRKGKLLMQGYPGKNEQQTSSSAALSAEKHNGKQKWDRNRSLELEGAGGHHRSRNWRRYRTDEFQAHLPFYQRPSFAGTYEHGSPSYGSHDEFHSHTRVHSLQMPQYGGGMHSGVNWKGNHIPAYNDHEAFACMYHDVGYGRHTRGGGWGQTSRFSGIPFSGESGMNRRHHAGHSCLCSGQFHNSYSSYHGSPQRHMEPGFYPGWNREIVSDAEDHHRRGRHGLQTYLRERQPAAAKRHLRPMAGGAPFVICYRCLGTLQLPVDFLIFKRKYHFLRCGTCKNVLRFSLRGITHLVPALADPQPKPSRDMDGNRSDNPASGSQRNEIPSKTEKTRSSSKNEELPEARGSPLHRLMGYSSVSQVFKASQRPPSLRISDYDLRSKN